MDPLFVIGLAATLIVIVGLSIYSGMHGGKGSKAKNGAPVVAGLIIGTLVGGSSTVGTAQLAFEYGMSAWWFTLGSGFACLVLALGYPSHKSTVVELKDSLDYYLDEERNYYVPKRALEDIVTYK